MRMRFFSSVPICKIVKVPLQKVEVLGSNFDLAEHFKHELEKARIRPRDTLAHLFVAKAHAKTVGFLGVEIGDGETIQPYIGESRETLFTGKTCLAHAVQVLPGYQKQGIQTLLWGRLSQYACANDIESIVFEPRNEEAYSNFFAKFDVIPKRHLLSQVMRAGRSLGEDIISIIHLDRMQIEYLNKRISQPLALRTENTCPLTNNRF